MMKEVILTGTLANVHLQNLFQLPKYPLSIRRIQKSATVSLWNGLQCQGPPVTSSRPETGTLSLKQWWPVPQALWRAWRLQPCTKSPSDPSVLLGEARHRLQNRQRQVAGCSSSVEQLLVTWINYTEDANAWCNSVSCECLWFKAQKWKPPSDFFLEFKCLWRRWYVNSRCFGK